MFLVEHAVEAVKNASNEISKIEKNSDVLQLEGMSSNKVRHLLNNLCSMEKCNYLEIGTWKGSTLISALYKNTHVNATAIDNFSEFTGPRNNFHENIKKYEDMNLLNSKNLNFLDLDCFKTDKSSFPKFNLYFYDGGHEFDDHYKAYSYFDECLTNTFITVVDDWNHKHDNARKGTRAVFKDLNYKVHYEVELPAKRNGDKDLWWNGIYVAVVEKSM